jgi:hypothetical protein
MSNLASEPEMMEDVVNESPDTQDVVSDDKFEIEIVDDTPEGDRGRPRKAEDAAPEIFNDDELDKYSEGVQKRFKKMTYEANEQRRNKEEAIRLREEALKYAESIKAENERLRKTLEHGEETLVTQAKGRVQAELDRAKVAYKEAIDAGDSDLILEANDKVTALRIEADKINSYRPQKRPASQVQAPQYQQQAPARPQPDARAIEWAKQNTWFENPETPEMTGYAYGVHQKLVESGIDPNTDQYYTQIDKAMRQVFPDKFDDGQVEVQAPQRQGGSVVAAPSRTTKKSRTVRLTSTQASLAKRLGLSNEQYAAQLMKDQSK